MSEDNDTTDPAQGDESAAGGSDQTSVGYDWQSPYRFTRSQLDEIDIFTRLACRRLSQLLTDMFRKDVQVQPNKPAQYFGFRLAKESIEQPEYWASIQAAGTDQRVGYVSFAKENAGLWIASLLGSLATDVSEGQTLSSLEQDLLHDITANMVQTFSDVLERACGCRIEATGGEMFGELDFQDSEEIDAFCKLTFTSPGEESLATSFVISTDFLGAIVGVSAPAKPDAAGSHAVQMEIVAHLHTVPIVGQARIGNGAVTMRDMMELQPGDVLLIDRRADDPIDFLIQDKRIFSGYPCIAGGRHGLQIVADQSRTPLQTEPAAEPASAE